MGLKGTWEDKVDGYDIVEAAHINSIANAVIEAEDDIDDIKSKLEEGNQGVEVVQKTGDSTEAVMSQNAVTDALAEKLDITEIDTGAKADMVVRRTAQGQIVVKDTPTALAHAASKGWVEKKLDERIAPIIAEIGTMVVTREEVVDRLVCGTGNTLPSGVRPNIYIEYVKYETEWENEATGESGKWTTATPSTIYGIIQGSATGSYRAFEVEQGSFIQLEDGEDVITFDSAQGDYPGEGWSFVNETVSYKLIYEVKVGA